MKNFKMFFTEAKVSEKRLEKVVDIFLRLMKKKLNTSQFFRFGGPKAYVEIAGGKGLLFIYDKNKAIRFNHIGGELTSVNLWTNFKIGKKSDFEVDFSETGLLQSAKKLLEIFKNPKTGTYEDTPHPFINEHLESDQEILWEATRVKGGDFYDIVDANIQSGQDITRMSWDELALIAANADVQVPGAVRSVRVKGTKGRNSLFDITQLQGMAKSSAPLPSGRISVNSGDTRTTSYSAGGHDNPAELARMAKIVDDAINKPNIEEQMKMVDSKFSIMKSLVQLVCRKARNSLIIYGGPGTGKTYTVTETVKQEGYRKGDDYFVVKGRITTASLYQTLYLHREGGLLVFDDTDSVWGDKEAANILKAALDSYEERIISWYSGRTVNVSKMSAQEKETYMAEMDAMILDDPTNKKIKLPSEFDYQGRIIFISNLPYDKFDSAVLTRSAKIDMSLTDGEMFLRIKSVLPFIGDKNVSMDVKEEILQFLKDQNRTGGLRNPSMRTYVAAEDLYKSGLPNWKELLDYI